MSEVLANAKKDADAFISGGIDALIFENNYDYPHKNLISKDEKQVMIGLITEIKPSIPFGVSVLWNDYKSALDIAKATKGQFIRVPVFVDRVKTQYGIVEPAYGDALSYRSKICADNILILTDVHVKHSEILNKDSLVESAKKAIKEGSDALIITGKWTGDAPIIKELKNVREVVDDFPIIVGSGANKENISKLLQVADGVIVSTALKEGLISKDNINRKSYNQRIDQKKVREFIKEVNRV